MYSNTRLVYDEKRESAELYKNGFEGEFSWRKFKLVCKYMAYELGYGKAKLKSQMITFSEKEDPNFNYVSNRKKIISIINSVMRSVYIITKPVLIRTSEISAIRNVKNFKYQKILLACLFLIKQKDGKKGVYQNDFGKIRIMLSKPHLSNEQIETAFGFLISDGLIGEPKGYYPLTFISEDSADAPIIILENTDASVRNLIGMYVTYCGGELGYCKICNTEFVKNSKHHLYCQKHTNERNKLRHIRYNSKRHL